MTSHHRRPDAEPTLDDLMLDPIIHLLMRRDGIDEGTVRRIATDAALRLRNRTHSDDLAA